MNKFENKVAIVICAGARMGIEISILFAKEGSKVALFDINEQNVRQAINEVKQVFGKMVDIP